MLKIDFTTLLVENTSTHPCKEHNVLETIQASFPATLKGTRNKPDRKKTC